MEHACPEPAIKLVYHFDCQESNCSHRCAFGAWLSRLYQVLIGYILADVERSGCNSYCRAETDSNATVRRYTSLVSSSTEPPHCCQTWCRLCRIGWTMSHFDHPSIPPPHNLPRRPCKIPSLCLYLGASTWEGISPSQNCLQAFTNMMGRFGRLRH